MRDAEKAENLKICLDGRFPTLCNRSLLTEQERNAAQAAEKRTVPARTKIQQQTVQGPAQSGCESGHWIQEVQGNGKILKLEDGSIWLVDDVDTVTSSIWLPISEVIVCGSKIINVDDDESIAATPLALGSSAVATETTERSYVVQAAGNDETFVINDEVFKAKTYCFGMEKGDKIIFLSGSPFGACASAELLNVRTGKVCRVWCE